MNELILATHNRGKIAELRELLAPINCIAQAEFGIQEAEETGLSFIENAIIKARHASQHTGKAALADDSGLVVQALHGKPGIYSSRFAGQNATDTSNIQRLLQALEDVADENRQAYFYCAIALVQFADDPTPVIACGWINGLITRQPSGDQGFGYDPIFYLTDYQCTMAELPAKIKNKISHRALALNQLRQQLSAFV